VRSSPYLRLTSAQRVTRPLSQGGGGAALRAHERLVFPDALAGRQNQWTYASARRHEIGHGLLPLRISRSAESCRLATCL